MHYIISHSVCVWALKFNTHRFASKFPDVQWAPPMKPPPQHPEPQPSASGTSSRPVSILWCLSLIVLHFVTLHCTLATRLIFTCQERRLNEYLDGCGEKYHFMSKRNLTNSYIYRGVWKNLRTAKTNSRIRDVLCPFNSARVANLVRKKIDNKVCGRSKRDVNVCRKKCVCKKLN